MYATLATLMGSRGLLKAYRSLRKGGTYEEGVIANTIKDINTQWYVNWLWNLIILISSIFTGSIFGLQVISGLGQILLYISFFISPLTWVIYLLQVKEDEGKSTMIKYIIGGILTSVLLIFSLLFTFKGIGALGILIPLILLSQREEKVKVISHIDDDFGNIEIQRGYTSHVLLSGLFRTLYVFISGEVLMKIINRGVDKEESDINSFHSEAISEALQPFVFWGYLLSRGEMDTFSQLSMSYILSSGEVLMLILIMLSICSIFFFYRTELIKLIVKETNKPIPYLDVLLITFICTLIMGNPIPILITITISFVLKMVFKLNRLPELSKSMSITLSPILLNFI